MIHKRFDYPVSLQRISPYGGQYFFGYYDLQPYNKTGDKHLGHRVPFIHRLQEAEDTAILGYFSEDGYFSELAETKAWNFQQGAMLQWHPGDPDKQILFNSIDGDSYCSVQLNIETSQRKIFSHPIACVAPDGTKALSINFSRLYDFRPGYGYAGIADPWRDDPIPADDGIFLLDLNSAKASLLLSLEEIWERGAEFLLATEKRPKLLVNHITWNTDSSCFIFLLRYISRETSRWMTSVLLSDLTGRRLEVIIPFGYASHYWWLNREEILFYSQGKTPAGGRGLYCINTESGEFSTVDPQVFSRDVHLSVFPGTSRILCDTYPFPVSPPPGDEADAAASRRLFLYDRDSRNVIQLTSLFSPPELSGDFRCDLHPRWDRRGKGISLDSAHEGFRGIYRLESEILSGD